MGFVLLLKEGGWNFCLYEAGYRWVSMWPKFSSVEVQNSVQKFGLMFNSTDILIP